MIIIVVQDLLLKQSLHRALRRMDVESIFLTTIIEADNLIKNNHDAIEAVIIDFDIDPESNRKYLLGTMKDGYDMRILVYRDLPNPYLSENLLSLKNIQFKEKPFMLEDIISILQQNQGGKNVSLSI
ncbi:MAG: hypothetical protein R6V77_03395 [Candidatus Cloacimonadaceae bacterium]